MEANTKCGGNLRQVDSPQKNLIIFLLLTAAVTGGQVMAESRLTIYTVNYPLQYFAQRIAGEHAQVEFPAPPDQDPAFWMPDAETIAQYQQADLILLNGVDYAKWVNKVSLPRLKMVDTAATFKTDYLENSNAVTHSHGGDGEHAHGGLAFTTWIDFTQGILQAETIKNALVRKNPHLQKFFVQNFLELKRDLIELDNEIKQIIAQKPDRPLLASHPIYQYFARHYKLNLKSVLWEPDEYPLETQWQELEGIMKDHPAQWMIWEGDPVKESIETLGKRKVNSLVFDPCGNRPSSGDFMEVMKINIENLRMAYQ